MIVNTHKLRNIPIGKLMRAALLAAVDGKFALRNHRGAKLILNQHDRDTYEAFATKAEQQRPYQLLAWSPWKALLSRVLVDEKEFLSWSDNDASSTLPAVETLDSPNRAALVVPSGLKSPRIEAHGGSPEKTESMGGAPSKKRWRGELFRPFLVKRYPPDGKLPDVVTTPQAYGDITDDMEAYNKAAKANKASQVDIPSYDAFEAYVGRAKPRRRKR
jgi:hypothetical protein